MESGQDQSDGLQNRKDDLINFSIPMDYSVDCTRNQREGLQTNDPLELLPSGTVDTQYSMCSKNTPGNLETNAVPLTDKVHLDDAISSTTVTVSYVNRPHLFSSERILQHSLHEQPLPSLFIPSVCVQSQQMLSASFDSSVSTNFVDSSFENSVLAQSDDLDSIRSGFENGIDCSTLNQHRLKALDLDLPLLATTIHESDSPLYDRSNTTEEILYEHSGASSDVETQDSVCQFSGVMGQENKWSDSEGSPETLVQNSEVLVMKLTASENRPNSNESQNLLGRMDHSEIQNGTEVFTGFKTSSSHHTENTLLPMCNLNINFKDQSTMTIKTENVEFSEEAVPANSEESLSEVNFGKTSPKVLKEGDDDDSPFCDKSKLPSTSMQLSQSLNADNYWRANTESIGTNTTSDCKAAPNACCSDMLQDSEKSSYTSSNIAVLQADNKSQLSSETGECLNDQEIALSFDVKNREMHCSRKDSIAIENNCSVQANCSSADNTISPPSENLVSNITVTEQSPNHESNCREPQKQIYADDTNDNILEAEPNLVPESLQKVNNVYENSRNITSFNKQTLPTMAKPSASESNHPRIKPCSLELHKLNVLETEGKGDVRGYVLDLKRNNVASMSCSISMSLSLSKSGKSICHEEEAESAADSDGKGDQSPSNDVRNMLSVQAEQQIPNRRKQNFVAKYEDDEVVCISDDEVVNCSVVKTDAQQDWDRPQVQDSKKRQMPCQQHLNQTFEGRSLQNAEPKHYERKILPPRQRGMRLEQIVQNIVTQPKSKTSNGERPRRNRDGPIPTPTRFQPPRHKSSSSVTELRSKGCAGSFPCIKGSSQKMSLECKMQEQSEANQMQGSSTAVEKLNRDKSTSIPGSCHGRATKLNTPVSSSKSSCSASTSSKQSSETYWEGHILGDKHKFGEPDIRCLNGNRRKHSGSSRNVSEPKNCMSSQAQSSEPRTQGTVRKGVHKSAGKKRQSQRGRPSMFFAPEEPEIKLRALTLKAEDRRERYDSFSPYVRVEAKSYSMCTVINYSEEDNNNLKQKKHSQQQSHGAVPKSSCLTLGPIINEAARKSFLVCCLCGLSANAMEQGDLFGPFYPRGYTSASNQISQFKEVKNEQASSVVTSSSCNSIRNAINKTTGQNQEPRTRDGATTRGQKRRNVDCMEDASKCSESKKVKNEPTLEEWYQPPLVPMDANEYWMHEDCVTWCDGVFLVRGKLYGLMEAISIAQEMFCSMCQKTGATLGCYIKGCPLKYHYACAVNSECSLNEDNFSMKCAKHKDRALKISTKVESR